MKKLVTLFCFFYLTLNAQEKPILLIERKYDFQKEENEYNVNNMLKGILINDFQILFDDESLPVQVANNRCLAYKLNLVDKSNMFLTKISFDIKDCQNNLIYTSAEIKSREKDIQKAYIEVMTMLSSETKKFKVYLIQNKIKPINETTSSDKNIVLSENSAIEKIDNKEGFVLLDSDKKFMLQAKKTSNPTLFIAEKIEKKGVLYYLNNQWLFEYYENNQLKSEIITIK